jgi:hypothetical protein
MTKHIELKRLNQGTALWVYGPYTMCGDPPRCSMGVVNVQADGLNVRIAPNGPATLSVVRAAARELEGPCLNSGGAITRSDCQNHQQ